MYFKNTIRELCRKEHVKYARFCSALVLTAENSMWMSCHSSLCSIPLSLTVHYDFRDEVGFFSVTAKSGRIWLVVDWILRYCQWYVLLKCINKTIKNYCFVTISFDLNNGKSRKMQIWDKLCHTSAILCKIQKAAQLTCGLLPFPCPMYK